MIAKTLISTLVAAAAIAPATLGSPGTTPRENTWFPLVPGTTYHYRGTDNGVPFTNLVTVTRRTKRILGVATTVVHDRVFTHGRISEDTYDWFARDAKGNVWYYGEDTKEFDAKGHVKTREGSWQAGVDGAKAGLLMPAHPKVGQRYRQEYYKGHAEDFAEIVSISGARIKTHEWSTLEPGVLDAKYYKRGVGCVREASVKGGHEYLTLVRVTHD